MPDQRLTITEPLLQDQVPRNACASCSNKGLLTFFSLLVGLSVAVLLSRTSLIRNGTGAHLAIQEPTINMAKTLTDVRRFQWPNFLNRKIALPTVPPAPHYEIGPLSEFVTTSAGVQMPRLMYQPEQKEARAKDQVLSAVRSGFRGIDTAGRNEPAVGAALSSLFASGAVARDNMFIQTMVNTSDAKALNPGLPTTLQVEKWIENSLSNLGLEYVDSLVLHCPGPSEQTTLAWRAMEGAVRAGTVRQLGISSAGSMDQLHRVYTEAAMKPAVVQPVHESEAEREMRAWCAETGLTVTKHMCSIASQKIEALAKKYAVTERSLLLRYAMGLGVVPLNSISSDGHTMQEDLSAWSIPLTAQDAEIISGELRHSQNSCLSSDPAVAPALPSSLPLRGDAAAQPELVDVADQVVQVAGAKAWLLGTMRAEDPKAIALYNSLPSKFFRNPLVATVKGVLAWDRREAQKRLLKIYLAKAGRSITGLKDALAGKVKKYGVAGLIAFIVQDILYWAFVIIPASSYMYHTREEGDGSWVPALSEADDTGAFLKLIGGVYLFSKIPPIEAARWAWSISMIPWFQERLPASLVPPSDEEDSELALQPSDKAETVTALNASQP
jgi:diketogulonate reductase-like aldo/keto reductase